VPAIPSGRAARRSIVVVIVEDTLTTLGSVTSPGPMVSLQAAGVNVTAPQQVVLAWQPPPLQRLVASATSTGVWGGGTSCGSVLTPC
jgi:hypothetical protein